jgi:hypothetical protein
MRPEEELTEEDILSRCEVPCENDAACIDLRVEIVSVKMLRKIPDENFVEPNTSSPDEDEYPVLQVFAAHSPPGEYPVNAQEKESRCPHHKGDCVRYQIVKVNNFGQKHQHSEIENE